MTNKAKANECMVQQNLKNYWGIEITTTKIEGVILDGFNSNAKALCRLRLPTARFCGYNHVISQVQLLVTELERISGINRPEKIGIATAGVAHSTAGVLGTANTLCLNGHTIQADLSYALSAEVFLANDVNCFTLGEALLGAGRGYNVVLGIVIETGIGGGIVIGDRLLQGLHGIAGEWGHNKMRSEKTPCHCGKRGCNEMVIAEPALERFYEKLTGEEISLLQIVQRANQGEEEASQTLARLQDKFTEAVSISINHLDPDVIVMGGGGLAPLIFCIPKRSELKLLVICLIKNLKRHFLSLPWAIVLVHLEQRCCVRVS